MADELQSRGTGPHASIFARKLHEIANAWRPRDVMIVARAIMFQVRGGALTSMTPDELAWLARDAEAAQEALASRAEFLARTAAAIAAIVAAVMTPIFAKAPLAWILSGCAAAVPLLLIALLLFLSSEAFKRVATFVGGIVKEVDEERRRRLSQSPPYRTGVRVEAPGLEAGRSEEQDPDSAQEAAPKKPRATRKKP